MFTPEDRAAGAHLEEMKMALKTGKALDERWHLRKDGTRFWCSGYMFALRDDAGNARGFAKIMRDTTERKKWEEEIQRWNQELEDRVEKRTAALRESYEQMETFTYTVAHDLRAPLRSMLGFAQAVFEEYAEQLDETAHDYLKRIIRASKRMDSLIQDLLAYSHITRTNLKFEPVSFKVVLDEVLSILAEEIDRKNGKVEVSGDLGEVYAHRATLQTIVLNLVSNALKFVEPGQPPQVQVRGERFLKAGKPFIRLSVIDRGIGIAPEHHRRIFKVFERLHGAESYTGTGIGLALVKKGVERMDGEVGLQSEVGKGSHFWIELPAV